MGPISFGFLSSGMDAYVPERFGMDLGDTRSVDVSYGIQVLVYNGIGLDHGRAPIGRPGLDEKRGPRFFVASARSFTTPRALRGANPVFVNHALADKKFEPQPLAYGSPASGPASGCLGIVMASLHQSFRSRFGNGGDDRNVGRLVRNGSRLELS